MFGARSVFILAAGAALLASPLTAFAGQSCTDACTSPSGQPCGAFNLGCPVGGGQCVQCTSNAQCAPGGTCMTASGMCVNLPCSPGAPMDASVGDANTGMDAEPGSDIGLNDGAIPSSDASTSDGSTAADSGPRADTGTHHTNGGGGRSPDDCSCVTVPAADEHGSIALSAIAAAFALSFRRRRR